ncbi:hypothetical protein [Amycolatopsis thailandensis]|uniref:hypothetical protein n=1 Tax=Amycolatopsis thailandensis TaxID=589330 RepID=UPI00362D8ECA
MDTQGNVRTTVSGQEQYRRRGSYSSRQEPVNRKSVITTHVEAKVAAKMIQSGQLRAELVLK